ncbi:MAG TPA: type I restriction-modification system subunit M N-terminal domain-containing protein [Nitrososphaeraceae archaeon]|nr:type I restriction-modification system subunit M N-terminal domain-containing protein [Nitrososphaeraceae archaeon]
MIFFGIDSDLLGYSFCYGTSFSNSSNRFFGKWYYAADILRGYLDPTGYRQPIMSLLFIKRLNDTLEENAEKLLKDGKSEKALIGFYPNYKP